jgi:hypothetical protein
LQFLAGELASAADSFRFLPDFFLGGLFVMAAELHLAEDALALHFLLQHLESLVDIVVTDENLHVVFSSSIERLTVGRSGAETTAARTRKNSRADGSRE